ncbi:hypothetical protein N8612_03015 [Verrucomicrobia bacterium]|nr:hypothetical protein [Verrucomicrobiota bacterium]
MRPSNVVWEALQAAPTRLGIQNSGEAGNWLIDGSSGKQGNTETSQDGSPVVALFTLCASTDEGSNFIGLKLRQFATNKILVIAALA